MSKNILILFFVLLSTFCFSQSPFAFKLSKTPEICLKASARLEISGAGASDTVTITWSNGQANTTEIYGLNEGDYSVTVKIKYMKDTLRLIKDTTILFLIEKEPCGVLIDKYFSPNDDGYHDKLGVVNVEYYPNFELNIFNKWGQQIHRQKKNYEPWDGKWNGVDLPDGTYYYVFFFDASKRDKLAKGDITILR